MAGFYGKVAVCEVCGHLGDALTCIHYDRLARRASQIMPCGAPSPQGGENEGGHGRDAGGPGAGRVDTP
jgi:hypothetical protein